MSTQKYRRKSVRCIKRHRAHKEFSRNEKKSGEEVDYLTEQLAWLRHCAAAEIFLSLLSKCIKALARVVSWKVDERVARIARFGSVETRSRSIRSGVALRIDEGKSVTPIESPYHVRSGMTNDESRCAIDMQINFMLRSIFFHCRCLYRTCLNCSSSRSAYHVI